MRSRSMGWIALLCSLLVGCGAANANVEQANEAPKANDDGTGAPDETPAPAAEGDLDATDLLAFEHLEKAIEASRASPGAIWKEEANGQAYAIEKMPIYFVRRDGKGKNERGYLFQHPSPKGTAITRPELAGLGTFHRYDGDVAVLADYPFSFGENVAGASAFVLPYAPSSQEEWDPSLPTSEEFFFILVHEAFHRYQIIDGAWAEYPDWTQEDAGYPIDRDGVALSLLENAILASGLRATTTADKEQRLRELVAVRKARIARPEATKDSVNYVEKTDLPQELAEGTATYAELRFRREAKLLDDAGIVAELLSGLERPIEETYESALDVRDELAFGRFYSTGAAIGTLLDDVGGIDWRSACKSATSPFQSVVARFPTVTGAEADTLLASAKSAHGYDALLTRADALLALPAPW